MAKYEKESAAKKKKKAAKKKAAKQKTPRKKAAKKKAAAKTEIGKSGVTTLPNALATVSALEARVAALEQNLAVTKSVASTGFAPKPLAQPVTVVLALDASGNTAKFSRLYFPGSPEHDVVNNLDKQRAELPGQQVGSTIQLMMEVRGDAGQKGSFVVQSATPNPLTLAVADGPKSPKLLFVSG